MINKFHLRSEQLAISWRTNEPNMICGLFKFSARCWNICSKRQQVWAHHIFWQQYLEAARPWPGHTLVFNIWDDVRRYGAIICHTVPSAQADPVYGFTSRWTETRWTDLSADLINIAPSIDHTAITLPMEQQKHSVLSAASRPGANASWRARNRNPAPA